MDFLLTFNLLLICGVKLVLGLQHFVHQIDNKSKQMEFESRMHGGFVYYRLLKSAARQVIKPAAVPRKEQGKLFNSIRTPYVCIALALLLNFSLPKQAKGKVKIGTKAVFV